MQKRSKFDAHEIDQRPFPVHNGHRPAVTFQQRTEGMPHTQPEQHRKHVFLFLIQRRKYGFLACRPARPEHAQGQSVGTLQLNIDGITGFIPYNPNIGSSHHQSDSL